MDMKLLTSHETLDYLLYNKCSMARFGDGENGFIQKSKGVPTMQKYNKGLRQGLHRVIFHPPESLLLCVHDEDTYSYVPHRTYGNSFVTRPTNTGLATDDYFVKFKQLWAGRDVHIINFYPGVVNSPMFDNVNDISYQSIPMRHCFGLFDQIKQELQPHLDKNKVFLLSCGPTATILAAALAESGEYALDVGKILFEYAKFMGDSFENLVKYLSQDVLAPKHKTWRKNNGMGIHGE